MSTSGLTLAMKFRWTSFSEVDVESHQVTPGFNIVTVVINEFDHELLSLIQVIILGRERK